MAIVVQKYGGSSVSDVQKLRQVAGRIMRTRQQGHDLVIVVSAMGDTTDDLLGLAKQVSPNPDRRELDMLLTAGERISMALLSMAIRERGGDAISFTGSQSGIMTNDRHADARIVEVRPFRVQDELARGRIVVIAGYQGVSYRREVTTLGRGGSDTTGVAMAAALGAEYCEICTDVRGVCTADPRLEPDARKVEMIGYDDMLGLAAAGSKVLQLRSVEYARRHGVRIHVRSSFSDGPGTWVQEMEGSPMEQAMISGVAIETDEAKVTLDDVPDRPGVAARVFRAVADDGINVDMIVQNVSHDAKTDLSFTVPTADLPRLKAVVERLVEEIGALRFESDDGIAKVSLVGAGMKSHPGVAADMFDALADEGINIEMISTSSIRISCVIRESDSERAVRAVHARFALGDEPAAAG